MGDNENLQPGEVSKEGTPPPEPIAPALPPSFMTKDEVLQLIAEATSTAREAGRREMQAIKDREVARITERAQLAEQQFGVSLEGLDEETKRDYQTKAELNRLRAEVGMQQQREQEESVRKQYEDAFSTFRTTMNQFITDLGVDPKDKRIDWGTESESLNIKQQKILSSVSKIQKENSQTAVQTSEKKLKQTLADYKAEIYKELGVTAVDTSVSAGSTASDAEFLKQFGSGELPATKGNRARYDKIVSSYT